ncbi:alpha/beta fold hydrolase [Nocardia sp. CDC159]|uniref:Alpha/beta fold hydrolase n=1 Tax=Nocardia pulmonis TaxID=2951408 RepID=A0A9X2E4N9_9NOCA|nr:MULTISPECIES: alpha/beta fold hydrolase [Nocardia]MCM6773555.1 alpha/beta fold hydrolase [Nocardia pulmonis]MCM6786442.1 alpha/beta fold hydrolase [Nocardia sp. CDC159]
MSAIYKSERGRALILDRYREALRQWPVAAEQLRVPTRAGETFVVASGPAAAPPLVLLHGSSANASTWRGDIARWATDFRVYAVDMVGEPGLSARARPRLDSEAVALWLDDVLDGLGLTDTAIGAISLGGWVGLDYAIRRPDRVTRLALLCPGGVGRQRFGFLWKLLPLRLFGRRGLRRSAGIVTGLTEPRFAPVLDEVVLIATHFRPRTERLPIFTDDQLRGLAMPVLVVVGGRDVMFDSAETARRMRELAPRATVRMLPEMGHAVVDQTETMGEFLRAESTVAEGVQRDVG